MSVDSLRSPFTSFDFKFQTDIPNVSDYKSNDALHSCYITLKFDLLLIWLIHRMLHCICQVAKPETSKDGYIPEGPKILTDDECITILIQSKRELVCL